MVPAGMLCAFGYGACATSERQHAERIVRSVQDRVIPPEASSFTELSSNGRPCVIGHEWSFSTPWTHGRYRDWLRSSLSDFEQLRDSARSVVFSRHDGGDAHSLVAVTTPAGDSMRVRVQLCVFPD